MKEQMNVIKIHDPKDPRDLYQGEIHTPAEVKECPGCGGKPVYCFPYPQVAIMELYCEKCGFVVSHWRVSTAINKWNKQCKSWKRIIEKNKENNNDRQN